jgi:SAM-dependent methyltransferase
MSDPVKPFNVRWKRAQRRRAAGAFHAHDFLHRRACEDVADRLEAVNRRFERVLWIGDAGLMDAACAASPTLTDKLGWRVRADAAPVLAGRGGVCAEPEALPFADGSFDLIVSILNLHTVNDLPGALIQLRRALAPDGLFIGVLFGDATLQELRASLLVGDVEVAGGAGPRIAPFADAQDMAGLLQRAGFALPVSDIDRVRVRYRDVFGLLRDVRGMGEAAALTDPAPPLRRAALARAIAHYETRFAEPDGKLIAQFDLLTITGWAPHESQQKPLRPGSAKARLADALGVAEQSAGEKTAPKS